jgi:hypothetical protein
MSSNDPHTDERFLDELLTQLSRPEWATVVPEETVSSDSPKSMIARIEFADSTGQVVVKISHQAGDPAVVLQLENPLDPNLPRIDSQIGSRVAQAHAAIGQRHSSAYCEPVEHEGLLLTASIPEKYNPQLVVETMAAFRHASIETDRCHQAVWSSLDVFITPTS